MLVQGPGWALDFIMSWRMQWEKEQLKLPKLRWGCAGARLRQARRVRWGACGKENQRYTSE